MDRALVIGRSLGRQGPIGEAEPFESIVRRIVANRLGVPESVLRPDVFFTRELAVDASALVSLTVTIERACGVSLPSRALDRVQTYGDLVEEVLEARLRRDRDRSARTVVFLRATVEPGPGSHHGTLTRSGWWSPYAKALLVDDARHAGAGATVTVTVPPSAPLATVEHIERELSDLSKSGIALEVHHARVSRGRAVA